MDPRLETLELLLDHVRKDAYALRNGDKAPSAAKRGAITPEMLEHHLNGGPRILTYLMEPGASTTRVAVIDFDDHQEPRHGWDMIAENARAVAEEARKCGLEPWPWRSSSGTGIHLLFWWDDPQDASDVRRLLAAVRAAAGVTVTAEIFPKQDRVLSNQYGNHITLPWANKSVPLDADMNPVERPIAWPSCSKAPMRAAPKAAEKKFQDAKLDEAREALTYLDSADYQTWMECGLILKHRFSEDGFQVWNDWAKEAPNYPGERALQIEWKRFKPNGTLTVGSLFYWAMEKGYRPPSRDRYQIVKGALCRMVYPKEEGEPPVAHKICNFAATIEEDITVDDGATAERQFRLSVEGRSVTIAVDDMVGNWWLKLIGANAQVYPTEQKHLIVAMQTVSAPKLRTVYRHLGWRRIDGKWLYLHAGGAIGADGPVDGVEVETEGSLKYAVLPPVQDASAAMKASLELLEMGTTGALLFAATYRAPLGEFRDVDFTVMIVGSTGLLKSAIVGAAQSHWGPHWDGEHLPENWSSTENAIERTAFHGKDTLLAIDDFVLKGSGVDVARQNQKADRIIRGQANRAGRHRMRPDGSAMPTYYSRAGLVATGEELPAGESLLARMVVRNIKKDEIDKQKLARLQEHGKAGRLSEAMAGYVQWLAARGDGLKDEMEHRTVEQRTKLRVSGAHLRVGENFISLLVGIEMGLEFAVHVGAIDEAEAKKLKQDALALFAAETKTQHVEQTAEKPAEQFREAIIEVLGSGRAYITNTEGDAPAEMEQACGWRMNGAIGEYQPQSRICIGWIDGGHLYLAEKTAKTVVQDLGVHINSRTIGRALVEAGWIARKDADKTTKNQRQPGAGQKNGPVNTYCLHAALFLGLGAELFPKPKGTGAKKGTA